MNGGPGGGGRRSLCGDEPVCPRCGYDLRGATSAWQESCPLCGSCPECGLEFEWAELLGQRRRTPRWCVEYGRLREVPWRVPRTLLMTLLPWRFWSTLRMVHDPRFGRVALHLVLCAVLLYPLFALLHGAVAWAHWSSFRSPATTRRPPAYRVVAQAVLLPWSETSPGPVTLALVSRSPPIVADPGGAGGPVTTLSIGPTTVSYVFPPPRDLLGGYWRRLPMTRAAQALAFLLLCPAGFLALPVSRKRARVRYRHVVRIGGYSLVLVMAVLAVGVARPAAATLADMGWRPAVLAADLAAGLLRFGELVPWILAGLAVLWWGAATSRYLRMPHPWGVAVTVVVMAGLCTALLWCLYYIGAYSV
jgi:hypothetical protein